MSAAATAAGYLYASGRLRGRAQREQEEAQSAAPTREQAAPRPRPERPKVGAVREPRRELRVAPIAPSEPKPRRAPTIQYRTRRWKPDAE